jgi:hypothetical protein
MLPLAGAVTNFLVVARTTSTGSRFRGGVGFLVVVVRW